MKRKLPVGLLLICALLLTLISPALAATDYSRIDLFDVDITVNENNTYHVVQNLRVSFSDWGDQHGIYELVDLRPSVSFVEDGEYYFRDYRIDIRNVESSAAKDVYAEDGILHIRLGDEDVIVDGRTIDYEISYDYDVGDDGFPDFDMFYFAVVGNDWNMPVEHTDFRIAMPKEFDAAAVGFSVGYTGESGYNPELLHFETDGTVISGSYDAALEPYEGIWIRVSLPAGYYTNVRSLDGAGTVCIWTALVLMGFVLLLYLSLHRKPGGVITVEVSPPAGLTPADIGYIVDGSVDDKDVLSLLIYWADEGCLKIVEIAADDGTRAKHPDFLFVRLRDLPLHANDYEKLMFDELFRTGDRISTKELRGKFYETVRETKKRIANKFTNPPDQVFRQGTRVASDLCSLLAAVPAAFLCAVAGYYESYVAAVAIILGLVAFFFGFAVYAWYSQIVQRWQSTIRASRRGQTIVWMAVAGGFLAAVTVAGWSVCGPYSLLIAGCSLLMALLAPGCRQRTPLGDAWEGQILGLKQFIERAEKDRLEMLVREQPEYFYRILPYAYVLGVSDTWSKQFESLATPPPDWFAGYDDGAVFTAIYFNGIITRTLERSQQTMVNPPQSSSGGGGGFSGGGFSGGGFGGSGGGTW